MTDMIKPEATQDGQSPQPETVSMRRSINFITGMFVFCVLVGALCESLESYGILGMPQTLSVVTDAAKALFVAFLTAIGQDRFQALKRS